MEKQQAYHELVQKRKAAEFPAGLQNPAQIASGQFDCEQLGPWSLWQGNLDAGLLVVGQNWGDDSSRRLSTKKFNSFSKSALL